MKDSTREMQDFINYVCSIYEKKQKRRSKTIGKSHQLIGT